MCILGEFERVTPDTRILLLYRHVSVMQLLLELEKGIDQMVQQVR